MRWVLQAGEGLPEAGWYLRDVLVRRLWLPVEVLDPAECWVPVWLPVYSADVFGAMWYRTREAAQVRRRVLMYGNAREDRYRSHEYATVVRVLRLQVDLETGELIARVERD